MDKGVIKLTHMWNIVPLILAKVQCTGSWTCFHHQVKVWNLRY
jgi:hypothetical protein